MKKILIAAAFIIASTTSFATGPNEKVLESFNKTFKHVSDVTWQEVDENFEASFTQNEITLRIQYDDQGNILRSIRYYNGQVLPIFIQSKIQKKFGGKSIYNVTEVTTPHELSYHIILEDDKTWTHIQSDPYGNMSVQKKVTKA